MTSLGTLDRRVTCRHSQATAPIGLARCLEPSRDALTLLRFFLILGSVMRAATAQTGNGLSTTGDGQLRSQKGPPGLGGPSLGRNAPKSKPPLGPVTGQRMTGDCFWQSSFKKENGCGIVSSEPIAKKSVHGFERPRFSRETADFSINTTSKDGSAPAQLQRPSHRKLLRLRLPNARQDPTSSAAHDRGSW